MPPIRSMRLLTTFMLRPDLALLVRHLGIDFGWLAESKCPRDEIPRALLPDGTKALSLAKNVQDLSVGNPSWLADPGKAGIRKCVSSMTLTRLELARVFSFQEVFGSRHLIILEGGGDGAVRSEDEWVGNIVARVRAMLRAQPQLKELALTDPNFTQQMASELSDGLESAYVPNLRTLKAHPSVAAVFLRVAPRIQTLHLTLESWGKYLASVWSDVPQEHRASVTSLTIYLWCNDKWVWSNLDSVLALWPNVKTLHVSATALTCWSEVTSRYYFRQLSGKLHTLPHIRDIELSYEIFHGPAKNDDQHTISLSAALECKVKYPTLETMIGPDRRMWDFKEGRTVGGRWVPRFLGRAEVQRKGPAEDLPRPQSSSIQSRTLGRF
ncbi:hypothetical protein FRB90_005746 [Tulasnella sp. 427]|nr:hypothetical protein FRB90_005746 [Tulasnella sp. 427]